MVNGQCQSIKSIDMCFPWGRLDGQLDTYTHHTSGHYEYGNGFVCGGHLSTDKRHVWLCQCLSVYLLVCLFVRHLLFLWIFDIQQQLPHMII